MLEAAVQFKIIQSKLGITLNLADEDAAALVMIVSRNRPIQVSAGSPVGADARPPCRRPYESVT
jgi:hypothetical protein